MRLNRKHPARTAVLAASALLPLALAACSGGTNAADSPTARAAAAASPLADASEAPEGEATAPSVAPSESAAPSETASVAASSSATETPGPVKGLWKSTSACIENKTGGPFEVTWTKYDTKQQSSDTVAPRDSSCAEGTFIGGNDVAATISFGDESRLIKFGAGNPAMGPPQASLTVIKMPEIELLSGICGRSFQDEGKGWIRVDDGKHNFVIERERDTNWKKFRVVVERTFGFTKPDISCS